MSEFATQHVDAMKVEQSWIGQFFIKTANGFVVRGPFPTRETAEVALDNLRERVREELAEERKEASRRETVPPGGPTDEQITGGEWPA